MGSLPPKHPTSGKVRRRRSHLALKPLNIMVDKETKLPTFPHKIVPKKWRDAAKA